MPRSSLPNTEARERTFMICVPVDLTRATNHTDPCGTKMQVRVTTTFTFPSRVKQP